MLWSYLGSTGQLETARKVLSKSVAALAPHVRDGGYVVGLEPSCTSVFHGDAPEMFPGDQDVLRLRDAGVPPERVETGCCGLAGNFGFEAGHGEISRAIVEQALLPRLRDAPADAVVLADGFSCRTQIAEFGDDGRQASHLAELLASATPAPRG